MTEKKNVLIFVDPEGGMRDEEKEGGFGFGGFLGGRLGFVGAMICL